MKIIIVGANGTVGKNAHLALKEGHEIVTVGKNSGQYQVDISDAKSVKAMFEKIGKFDALVSATGDVAFAPLSALTADHWETGIRSKFLGQVNLVQIGKDYINEGGSFTLTSGILSEAFIAAGTSATAINRALEGFALSAAAEIGRGIRINVVSPGMLEESQSVYGAFFPGHIGVSGARVGQAFKRSVLGIETGRVFKVTGDNN
jgi:NAD(P)-dependent dehydrogenase (short-subunit alcohol dehydrogenase family)